MHDWNELPPWPQVPFLRLPVAGMGITQLIISEYKEVPLALTPMGRVSASIIDNLGGCLKFKPANKVFLSSSQWGNAIHNRQRALVWLFFAGFNQDT